MISVTGIKTSGGASKYYAKDNYWSQEQNERASAWGGRGAAMLGLKPAGSAAKMFKSPSPVASDTLEAILEGNLPDGATLGREREDGTREHMPGFELGFNVDKSISIMALVAEDERVVEAFQEAMGETLQWLEENAASLQNNPRNGPRTVEKTQNMVAAVFTHTDNRLRHPDLHAHALIANATKDPKTGEWRAMNFEAFHDMRATASAIFEANLGYKLRGIGYTVVRDGKYGSPRIEGVPKELTEAFSQRRAEIVERAGPDASREERQAAALATRNEKVFRSSVAEQREDWAKIAHPLMEALNNTKDTSAPSRKSDIVTAVQSSVRTAIGALSESSTVFSRNDVLRESLNDPRSILSLEQVDYAIDKAQQAGELIFERKDGLDILLTTSEGERVEARLLDSIEKDRDRSSLIGRDDLGHLDVTSRLLETGLNESQLAMVSGVLFDRGRIALTQGDAGTGKTFAMQALVAAIEGKLGNNITHSGNVYGFAPSDVARGVLKEGTGIEVETTQWLTTKYKTLASGEAKAAPKDLAKYEGSVFVVDEASLLSHAEMQDILDITEKLGVAKVLFMGDTKQHASVRAGRAFGLAQEVLPAYRMDTILRQTDPRMKAAVEEMGRGEYGKALRTLDPNMREVEDVKAAIAGAAEIYINSKDGAKPLIVSMENRTREGVNRQIREGLGLGAELTVSALKSTHTPQTKLRMIETYRQGQVLVFHRDVGRGRFPQGSAWRVTDVRGTGKGGGGQLSLERIDAPSPGSKTGRSKPAPSVQKGKRTKTRNGRRARPPTVKDPSKGAREIWRVMPDRRDSGFRALEKGRRSALPYQIHTDSEREFATGEPVIFRTKSRELEVNRDTSGRITATDGKTVDVRLDDGRDIRLDKDHALARFLDHDYATTSHKAQGRTTEGVVMVEGARSKGMDKKSAYVGISRGKSDLTIMTDSKRQMVRSVTQRTDPQTPLRSTQKLLARGRLDTRIAQSRSDSVPGGVTKAASPSTGPSVGKAAKTPSTTPSRSGPVQGGGGPTPSR